MIRNQTDDIIKDKKQIKKDSCSCTSCDSLGCFVYRQYQCPSYEKCNNSKTCIFYKRKSVDLNESRSNSNLIVGIKKEVSTNCIYEVMNVHKTTMVGTKYTDILIETNLKNLLEKNSTKNNSDIEKPIAAKHDELIKNFDKESPGESPRTKISSQIMNIGYKDFKKSISCNRPDTSSFKVNKMSKYDIFQKIKQVYQACSCKVCECIGGTSLRNDMCKCKPCECNDCLKYSEKLQQSVSGRSLENGCGCNEIEKNSFGRFSRKLNKSEFCNCKPCECIECADRVMNSCSCNPCQCYECKSMSRRQTPVVVAPAVGNTQLSTCQCSPCECIECAHGMPSAIMHEMSTGTNVQGNSQCRCEICQNEACESNGLWPCKCEKHTRVMSKPVERDTYEYDLRTVLVNNFPTFSNRKGNRHNTITMYATVSNTYANVTDNNKKQCNCDECECIVCSYNEDAINAIKSSQLFTPPKLQMDKKTKLKITDACKCSPCECEICYRYKGNQPEYLNKHSENNCLCDECICVSCRRQKMPTATKQIGKMSTKDECKCYPCECTICHKIISNRKTRLPYSTCMICKQHIRDVNVSSEWAKVTTSVSTSQDASISCRDSDFKTNSLYENLSVSQAFPILDFPQQTTVPTTVGQIVGTIKQANMNKLKPKRRKCSKTCNISKCEAYTQYRNNGKSLHKNDSTEYKSSGSYISGSSYTKSNSKSSSYCKDNGSGSHLSAHRFKSCESSCNSSGYDHPEYLMRFPKSTVETCLKEVMKLNLDKNIKLDKVKIVQNPQTKYLFINNPSYETSISGKQRLSQSYEDKRRHKKQTKSLTVKRSSHKRYKKKSYKYTDTPLFACCRRCDSNKLPEKMSIHIAKNISTQTNEHCIQQITKNTSSVKLDRYEREDQNGNSRNIGEKIHNCNHIHSFLNDGIPSIKSLNEQFPWNYLDSTPLPYFTKRKDCCKMDEDYKRIHKTLQEAKIFSSHLLKLLEKYEKENRDFESISEKLKHSYDKIISNNKSIENAATSDGQNSVNARVSSSQYRPKLIEKDLSQCDTILFQKTLDETNIKDTSSNITPNDSHNSGDKVVNEQKPILMTGNCKDITSSHTDCKRQTLRKPHKNYGKVKSRVVVTKRITLKNDSEREFHCATTETEIGNMLATKTVDKETSTSIIATLAENSVIENDKKDAKTLDLKQVMRKLDSDFGSTTEISVSTSVDKLSSIRKKTQGSATMQRLGLDERTPWPILKKNFNLVTAHSTKNRGVCIIPNLELEVKEGFESISLQTRNKEKTNHVVASQSQPENALVSKFELELKDPPKEISLQTSFNNIDKEMFRDHLIYSTEEIDRQVRELLNLSILQPIMKRVLKYNSPINVIANDCRMPRIESSISTCGALKVSFLGVRRVSDHTVLVKWNLPKEVTDVQGFELLVDGRAVQKIFSPSRCMAVVTCLPHSDKILLTIRTITSKVAPTGHYPAASIIYHPRVK